MNPAFSYPSQQMQANNLRQQIQTTPFVWVENQKIAENWPLNPGSSIVMMDTQEPVIYIKTVDVMGRVLPLEIYDMVKREPDPGSAYVTKAEIESLFEQYLGKNRPHNKYYGKPKKSDESEVSE